VILNNGSVDEVIKATINCLQVSKANCTLTLYQKIEKEWEESNNF
jgi:hypothetical protein